jgi:hypothetical protein
VSTTLEFRAATTARRGRRQREEFAAPPPKGLRDHGFGPTRPVLGEDFSLREESAADFGDFRGKLFA